MKVTREMIAFVEKLREAGVPVEFKVFEGCFHAFEGLVPKARISMEASQYRNRWFQHAIHTCFAPRPVLALGLCCVPTRLKSLSEGLHSLEACAEGIKEDSERARGPER